MERQPALGTFRVTQRWQQADSSALRCENTVTIGRPNGGLLSAWTLLPAGGESSLRLQHRARVDDDGTQTGRVRMSIELDAVVLDGNRAAGDPAETIVQMPVPPRLPGLPAPPPLRIPGASAAVADAGTFDITYLDESVRIVRAPGILRVFIRDDLPGALPTW